MKRPLMMAVVVGLAVSGMAAVALAGPAAPPKLAVPVQLTDAQMDQITAGARGGVVLKGITSDGKEVGYNNPKTVEGRIKIYGRNQQR